MKTQKKHEKIDLAYSHDRDMSHNHQVHLMFKASFLSKVLGLKLDGQCYVLKWWIHDWIQENIDDIWEQSEAYKKHFFGLAKMSYARQNLEIFYNDRRKY